VCLILSANLSAYVLLGRLSYFHFNLISSVNPPVAKCTWQQYENMWIKCKKRAEQCEHIQTRADGKFVIFVIIYLWFKLEHVDKCIKKLVRIKNHTEWNKEGCDEVEFF
jgi:hypothetical protein